METEEKQVVRYNIITVDASKLIKKLNVMSNSDSNDNFEFDYENPRQWKNLKTLIYR